CPSSPRCFGPLVVSTSSTTDWRRLLLASGYDDRACIATSTRHDVAQTRDHAGLAGRLDEATDGVDLGPHRPAGELTLGGVLTEGLHVYTLDRPRMIGAVVEDGV